MMWRLLPNGAVAHLSSDFPLPEGAACRDRNKDARPIERISLVAFAF